MELRVLHYFLAVAREQSISAAAESLRSAGMEIRGDEHIVVAAFSLPDGAHPELLPMAERIFSRAFSCTGSIVSRAVPCYNGKKSD